MVPRTRTTGLGLFLVLLAAPALGQTAGMLSFQGFIKDVNGDPVTGSVDLVFRIYDAEAGGNLVDMDGDGDVEDVIGEDAKEVVGVAAVGGLLSTKFGPVAPSSFDGGERWLEVSVNGTALSRVEMATAPATAEQLNLPGSGIPGVTVTAEGDVGIGTNAPAQKLDVRGQLQVRDSIRLDTADDPMIVRQFDPMTSGRYAGFGRWGLYMVSEKLFLGIPGTDFSFESSMGFGGWRANSAREEWMTIKKGGNVGIGTTEPVAKLHITDGNDASAEGGGFIIIGDTASTNIAIDNNEIMARDNGVAAQLRINRDGGTVTIGGNGLGMLGVGTAAPETKIHVKGGTDVGLGGGGYVTLGSTDSLNIAFDNNEIMARNNGFTSQLLLNIDGGNVKILSNPDVIGNVGIGTNEPQFLLHVDGDAGKPDGGSWSSASDRRLKKNIRRLAQSLERLLQLRGVRFEYKSPETIHERTGERIGMIAQEVEETFPDWVHTASDGYKRLTFRGFEALTVEALRELRGEKDAQIAELKMRLDRMEALMGSLTHTQAGGSR